MMNRINYCIVISFLLMACGNENKIPKDVIEPKKMLPIVWDLTKAETFWENRKYRDSTLTKDSLYTLYSRVFALHKISKVQFYKSFSWYQKHPANNRALLDSLNNMAQHSREMKYSSQPKISDSLK